MAAPRPTKGFGGLVKRASLLPIRYGLRSDRILSRLRMLDSVIHRWETAATVPVTAAMLDRHPEIVKDLAPFDLAIHGHRHIAYSRLSASDQARDLDAAIDAFSHHGLVAKGFRAPYLRVGTDTLRLLRERGFAFDSSQPRVVLPEGHPLAGEVLRLARARYGAVPSGPSVLVRGDALVELPVAMPDDEILVDALGIGNPQTLLGILLSMVGVAARSGSLLVFQIHPERFHLFAETIDALLRKVTDLGAWKAPLSEVAAWILECQTGSLRWPKNSPFAVALSGDLDAITLGDFARRL